MHKYHKSIRFQAVMLGDEVWLTEPIHLKDVQCGFWTVTFFHFCNLFNSLFCFKNMFYTFLVENHYGWPSLIVGFNAETGKNNLIHF